MLRAMARASRSEVWTEVEVINGMSRDQGTHGRASYIMCVIDGRAYWLGQDHFYLVVQ